MFAPRSHLPAERSVGSASLSRRLAVLAVVLLSAALPSTAAASFSGSSGKVAWIHDGVLRVDDPYDDAGPRTITTVPKAQDPLDFFAPASAVAWSPDGTKLAFVRAVPNGVFQDKDAIFVADLSQSTGTDGTQGPITWEQVSFPYPGKVASCNLCKDGEVTYDHAPAWTPEGDLVWIRAVYADVNAPHSGENGSTVRAKAYEGGRAGVVGHFDHQADGIAQSLIWPQGADEPAAILETTEGTQVVKAISKQQLTHELGVDDMDASPDGSRLVIKSQTLSGAHAKVLRWSTGEVLYDHKLAATDTGVLAGAAAGAGAA